MDPILLTGLGACALVVLAAGFIFSKKSKAKAPLAGEPSRPAPKLKPTSELRPTDEAQSAAFSESVAVSAAAAAAATSLAPAPVAKSNLQSALRETEKNLFGRLRSVFSSELVDKNFDEIEEVLYTSDLGPQTVERLMDVLKENFSKTQLKDLQFLKKTLGDEFAKIFAMANMPEPVNELPSQFLNTSAKPTVLMVVGVNGVGKTTSIGKVAAQFANQGKKVLVAAGDTFRAAAANQLRTWTDRAQVEIFSPEGVKDPSAVAFDAVAKAKAGDFDIVIVDTAGRLHTQDNLMAELKKMKKVMSKILAEAPHETLIVLDANSGQNALQQAREFHSAVGLTGVILTKMDGTAKGGVAIGLANELKIPIRMIGIGEKMEDLRAFSSKEFIQSILG